MHIPHIIDNRNTSNVRCVTMSWFVSRYHFNVTQSLPVALGQDEGRRSEEVGHIICAQKYIEIRRIMPFYSILPVLNFQRRVSPLSYSTNTTKKNDFARL